MILQKTSSRLGLLFFFSFLIQSSNLTLSEASRELSPKNSLTPSQRESLYFHLENLYNEVHLLFRNEKVDRSDVNRQRREFEVLKVFERIPFTRNLDGLKKELSQSASEAGIQLKTYRTSGFSPKPKILPKKLFTNASSFKLKDEQLVEEIFFKVSVKGPQEKVKKWIQSWVTHQMRLIELDLTYQAQPISLGKDLWEIQAHAFRFRQIRFPTLLPRNPQDYLPKWAKKNPKIFASAEPLLWNYVKKINAIRPHTSPYYKVHEEFHLNDYRMTFFISKSSPKKERK